MATPQNISRQKMPAPSKPRHGKNQASALLAQMLLVLVLLCVVIVWQWELVYQIYLKNQVNIVGWSVNGGILFLFLCGFWLLMLRFSEYSREETAIVRFLSNLNREDEPLLRVPSSRMIAARYLTLKDADLRRSGINQNALAATLLACESSRNSFLKFIHNVLILLGVFGTIISLSLSLLGASDIITGSESLNNQTGGLGTIIYGMSTALSTTMTAILAYLIFGYFYIRLNDTQTYLISRVEEITAIVLLPHLKLNQSVEKDYSDAVRTAAQLIDKFAASWKQYDAAVRTLMEATQSLSGKSSAGVSSGGQEEVIAILKQLGEQQQRSADEAIGLLREGFRLPK